MALDGMTSDAVWWWAKGMEDVKALSLWQPWASLIAWYEKSIETRPWGTAYRGLLAIHATRSVPGEDRWYPGSRLFGVGDRQVDALILDRQIRKLPDLPHGAIVAVAVLENVVQIQSALHARRVIEAHGARYEEYVGGYDVGRYMWLLKEVVGLEKPVPGPGRQGMWDVPKGLDSLVLDEYERRLPEERSKNRSMGWLV